MKEPGSNDAGPDIDAAMRSGFWSQRMDDEGAPALSNLEQATYWRHICADIVEMQERVLYRISRGAQGLTKTVEEDDKEETSCEICELLVLA